METLYARVDRAVAEGTSVALAILVRVQGSTPREERAREERVEMSVTVGKEAPNFEVSAYHEGGFKNIKLSDFRGKWVFLCFYPGDFTFV